MRGAIKSQPELVCLISPDSVVPKEHPIRTIKKHIDEVLRRMSQAVDSMHAQEGRPSIPPERLLKAKVLIALFSVRSENLFVEQLHYNLLYRWFLDMDLSEPVFDGEPAWPLCWSASQFRGGCHPERRGLGDVGPAEASAHGGG